MIEEGGEQYLALTFTRDTAIADVQLAGQASGDLAGWSDAEVVEVSRTDHGNGTETVVLRDTIPVGDSGETERFLRLAAILAAP